MTLTENNGITAVVKKNTLSNSNYMEVYADNLHVKIVQLLSVLGSILGAENCWSHLTACRVSGYVYIPLNLLSRPEG